MTIDKIGSIIKKIRMIEGLSQEQLAKKLGVSSMSIHSYEHNKRTPSMKLYPKLMEMYPDFKDQILSITEKDRENITKGEHQMPEEYNSQLVNSSQKDQELIALQKEKIERLEHDLKIKEQSPVQDTVWKELQYDFQVDISVTFDNFVLGRTINKVSNKESLTKHLGYDLDEIRKYWAEGVYYKHFTKHPIDQIITKESLESVEHNVETMPTLFETFKMMVGNHYIPIPITYIHKDGSHVHTICYNKVDWLNKSIESKCQFISQ